MRKVSLMFVLAALLTGAAGCFDDKSDPYVDDTGRPIEPERLPISNELQFSDVPVPYGFEFQREASFVYKTDSVRIGHLRYTGKAGLFEVIKFFEDNMSASGWGNGTTSQFSGRASMRYEKRDEVCVIDLDRDGSRVNISMKVSPAK